MQFVSQGAGGEARYSKNGGENVLIKFNLIQYTYNFFIIQLQEEFIWNIFELVDPSAF